MPADTKPEIVEVRQAARDAAADFLRGDGHAFDALWHPAVRAGERDDHVLVQFAEHAMREAERVERERVLEEAAKVADDTWGDFTGNDPDGYADSGFNDACTAIAAAIRNLKDRPNAD